MYTVTVTLNTVEENFIAAQENKGKVNVVS
jgi:hypothetical protein